LIKRLGEESAENALERARVLVKGAKKLIANRRRVSSQQEAEVFEIFCSELKQVRDSTLKYLTLMTEKALKMSYGISSLRMGTR
jgi:hypothetical protein